MPPFVVEATWAGAIYSQAALLVQRASAIRRRNVCLQKISYALIRINLIFDAREAVAFVLVDLSLIHIYGPPAGDRGG